jgi:hypothetical protein
MRSDRFPFQFHSDAEAIIASKEVARNETLWHVHHITFILPLSLCRCKAQQFSI